MSKDLLDYHDALRTLLESHTPLATKETVALASLHGRILAEDIAVQHDVPEFDNSAMDGYAIHGNDLQQWHVTQRIAAGNTSQLAALDAGQAARIFTGAPIPPGTTAVMMQEHVQLSDAHAFISKNQDGPISSGQHIRRQAEELQKGQVLLKRGHTFTPASIGLLAGQGYAAAPVVKQLRVTVFSSGNELVQPGQALQTGQIYDSNRIMLITWLKALGFAVTDGGSLPDQLETTKAALTQAAFNTDAILCSGGVSVGEEDHLKNALTQVGTLIQWRLFIKPGKPFTWGHIAHANGQCRVFMLPGNPVSSLVTFQQLALPALRRLSGQTIDEASPWQLKANANFSRAKAEPRREFIRVVLSQTDHGWQVSPVAQQGSNMLSGAVHANALAETAPGTTVASGDVLTVYPLFQQL